MTDETRRLLDKLDHNLNDILFDLVEENETLEGQVNELREQVARLTEKFGANCSSCVLDRTDACSRGAGRAVDDEICEDYISTLKENKGEDLDGIKRDIFNACCDDYHMPVYTLSCDEIFGIIDKYKAEKGGE